MRLDSAEASELTIGVSGLTDIYDYFTNPVRHSVKLANKLAKMGKCRRVKTLTGEKLPPLCARQQRE
jgi:hypothetical protein